MSSNTIFVMNDRLYRLESKSEHRGEVIIRDAETKERTMMSLARWNKNKRAVWTIKEVAEMFQMHPKSLYRWLRYLEFPSYEIIYQTDVDNPVSSKRSTNYYTKKQVLSLYDMIVRVRRAGHPAKDRFKEPKFDLPTRAELLAQLNESDLYYMKKGDKFVPVFKPEWT